MFYRKKGARKKAAIQTTAVLLVSFALTAGGAARSWDTFEAVNSIAFKDAVTSTQVRDDSLVAEKTNAGSEKPPNPGDGSDKHTMTLA